MSVVRASEPGLLAKGTLAFSVLRRAGHGWPETAVALILFALIWHIASYIAPPYAVPSWARIVQSLVSLPVEAVAVTLIRVIVALVISFVIGLGLAVTMYAIPWVENFGRPLVRILMAVPVVCWIIFAVLWFPWAELRIAFVLVVVCGPVFLVDLLDDMKNVPKDLREMMWSFRPSAIYFFLNLILPATLPAIFTSWKINLSLGIRIVTMAELVGATTGIGYQLVVAQELFSVADVFAWTMVLVVALFATEAIVWSLERRYLRWRV